MPALPPGPDPEPIVSGVGPHGPSGVVEPKDAATVLLCRDRSGGGLEVFMVRRHLNSAFMGGAYVFPGGKVDDADRDPEVVSVCTGLTDAEASARLGFPEPRGGLAFWVAAVRECFEEAGVLLARRPDDSGWLDVTAAPALEERFSRYRRDVTDGNVSVLDMCRAEGLVMDLGSVGYLAHWITPPNLSKRFDTRFLVAAAPSGQQPLHDEYETVDSLWIAPDEAVARYRRRELPMAQPTVVSLAEIGRFSTVAELLAYCHRDRRVVTHRPGWSPERDGAKGLLPGEPGYGA